MANRPWHYDLPWNSVRSGYRWMRRTFFTVSKPDGPYFVVDADLDELRELFGVRSHAPNWEFSYNYQGEDLNLARVFYDPNRGPDGVDWWQYHVRAFERDDGLVEFTGHVEPEPTEHAKPHLRGTGYDTSEAMDEFGRTLDAVPAIDVVEDPR